MSLSQLGRAAPPQATGTSTRRLGRVTSEKKHRFRLPKQNIKKSVAVVSLFRVFRIKAEHPVNHPTQTSTMKTLVSIFFAISSLQNAISQTVESPVEGNPAGCKCVQYRKNVVRHFTFGFTMGNTYSSETIFKIQDKFKEAHFHST